MNNKIRTTTLEIRRLSAAEAEVWVHVELETVTATTELRGKLHGPRCPGVTTVEIAYPFRTIARLTEGSSTLTIGSVIPEPNLWTDKTPFVYEGAVELWEAGRCCDRAPLSVGFKLR
ncbi:MAG: hypothetical protein K2R98_03945 [Gemmataceae bacterium]|nr:hypothetical protein [Gemmataceae bacterium]